MRAARLEIDERTHQADAAPPVVLPAPALHAAVAALFETVVSRAGRADAIHCRAIWVDAVVELQIHRIVCPAIRSSLAPHPDTVAYASRRLERHLEVVRWRRRRGGNLGGVAIQVEQARAGRGRGVLSDRPVANNDGRLRRTHQYVAGAEIR